MEGDNKEQKPNLVEASSTTPGDGDETPTKRSIRVKVWRKFREARCGVGYNAIFNRIPNFIGAEKAADLLAETPEFKKAKHIKVNIDRSQDAVKLHVLTANKTLYLPPTKESSALFTEIVNCPPDADEAARKKIIKTVTLVENRKQINVEDKVKLDMIVIGSVAVSREGHRIGKGNGFVDLDIGILTETGAITPETVIVTTVHEFQLHDTLPLDLFQKYDTPVDIIVTPTEVIRVTKKLPRPTGIFWELLSERRLKIVPVLQTIKEAAEKAGKIITLKSEDTDIETNARNYQQNRRQPRRRQYRRFRNRNRSENNNDESNKEENNDSKDRPRRRRPRYNNNNRRRRTTTNKSEGEQSSGENKENLPANQRKRRNQNQKRRRGHRDFCIKVSNIARGTRIRDLKAELRKRECNPIYISWKGAKGAFGRCFLHFSKRSGTDKDTEIEKVLKSLNDLTLEIPDGEQNSKKVNLAVELLKIDDENNRIESVNTTSV